MAGSAACDRIGETERFVGTTVVTLMKRGSHQRGAERPIPIVKGHTRKREAKRHPIIMADHQCDELLAVAEQYSVRQGRYYEP
jgi:hypothetical protein